MVTRSWEDVRADFPILDRDVHGHPLGYLDNAATTQKPRAVLDMERSFYERSNANVRRAGHGLAEEASDAYERARSAVAAAINARESREIVFVRGATEAINLVAHGLARSGLGPSDEIVVTAMEHHANIVPWQRVREDTGAQLRVVPIHEDGTLNLGELDRLLSRRTKLVALTHASNVLGTINPIGRIVDAAKAVGAMVLVDGAQAVAHLPVDVQALRCDFYAFSGHKVYGPMGIGALHARAEHLERMAPFQLGGGMIQSVRFEATTYQGIPHRFEAGTPNIAGALGLAAALRYLDDLGLDRIGVHERALTAHLLQMLRSMPGVRLLGEAQARIGVVSFVIDGLEAHDVGAILDQQGIAVRTGHHCCQPLMDRLGVDSSVRVSLALYSTREEVDRLGSVLASITSPAVRP